MNAHLPRLVIAAVAVAALIGFCGCGSSSSGSSSFQGTAGGGRLAESPAMLIQCLIAIRKLSTGNSMFAGRSGWLHGRQIVLTRRTESDFNDWFDNVYPDRVRYGGHTLAYWQLSSARHKPLPRAVCGPALTATALFPRIYAHGGVPDVWPETTGRSVEPSAG
jgi:hypothetical protein